MRRGIYTVCKKYWAAMESSPVSFVLDFTFYMEILLKSAVVININITMVNINYKFELKMN